MAIAIETVRADGYTMNYFRFGHGEKTMVILPGLSVQSVMGAGAAVAKQYECMTGDFTVYLFDRRAGLPETYSVADMARDTAEAFRVLGLKDVYLFGASQGGMIAMLIAIDHPELVAKLVLGSTTAEVTPEGFGLIARWIDLAKNRDGAGLYQCFGETVYPPAVFEQYRPALILLGRTVTDAEFDRFVILAESLRGFSVLDRLDRIQCPVLAVGDRTDAVVGAEAVSRIAEKLGHRPDFRMHLYDGFGHAAYDTAPDYRERMLRFFNEQEGETL